MKIERGIKSGCAGTAILCLVALIVAGCLGLPKRTVEMTDARVSRNRNTPATPDSEVSPSSLQTDSKNSSSRLSHNSGSAGPAEDARHSDKHWTVAGGQGSYTERTRKRGYLTRLTDYADSPKSSEERRARLLARELAGRLPRIRKIKLCRDLEERDWWICLYQEEGRYFELQQYTWNVYQDRPQPFLVLEKIAGSGLQKHLNKVNPGMKCRVLDPPKPRGWLAQLEGARGGQADGATSLSRVAQKKPTGAHLRKAQSGGPENGPSRRGTKSLSQSAKRPGARAAKPPQTGNVKSRRAVHRERETKAAARKSRRPARKTAEKKTEMSGTRAAASIADRIRTRHMAIESDQEPRFRHAYAPPGRPAESLVRIPANGLKPSFRAAVARRSPETLSSSTTKAPETSSVSAPPPSASSQPIRRPSLSRNRQVTSELTNKDSRARSATYYVFAYGSKMNHTDFLAWLSANGYDPSMMVDVSPGVLSGYGLVWNFYSATRRGGAVNVEPRSGSRIWGLLMKIEDPLLRAFDRREGHPNVYSRGQHRVAVKRVTDGKTVFAWLYRAKPNRGGRRDVWPTVEYKQKILEAALFWHFPQDYVLQIESWKTR